MRGIEVATVAEVKAKYEASLMAIPGVVGVGERPDAVIVYVKSEDVIPRVPTRLDGVPVQVVVVGEVRPL